MKHPEINEHQINEFDQPIDREIKNWSKRNLPSNAPMTGKHCIVEPLNINKHAADLFQSLALNNRGESWTYLPYGPFSHGDEFQQWLATTMAAPDTRLYAIVDTTSHVAVGIAGYLRIDPEHGSIEVGHLHFSTLLKRTPAATEAMYLMMQHAFVELGYRRYEWKCNALNQASRNAALRLGFTFEGIFRQCNVFKDRNRDTAWFSILDSEWPALEAKFQRWLNPANFDANGKQIRSLGGS